MGANGGGFTDEHYMRIKEIARVEGETGDFGAEDILGVAMRADPSITIGIVEAGLDALTGDGHLRRLAGTEPARWEVYDPGDEPESPT